MYSGRDYGLLRIPTQLTGTSQVQLQLLNGDLNRIKAASSLANSPADTFIVLPETVIADSSGTLLVPVTEDNAQMAAGLVLDTSPPTLVNVDLDLDSGTLLLQFSEIVITSTFTVSSLELQETSTSPSYTVPLATSTFSGNRIDVITVMLSVAELETIKLQPLCTNSTNCYITIQAAVVTDLFGQPNLARQINDPAPVSNFTADTTPPMLVDVTLININTGELTLQFNEPVNILSMNISALMLHSTFRLEFNSITATLSNSTSDSVNGRAVHINLTDNDLDEIKIADGLCESTGSCYIRFSSDFIQDMSGNPVIPLEPGDLTLGISLTGFQPDSTRPNLIAFDFDLNNRLLVLEFDEPVRANSFEPDEVTLQSAASMPSVTGKMVHC